jgi:two-component system, NtrC family, nitrogen regulation sensor histidine kinase NtrY
MGFSPRGLPPQSKHRNLSRAPFERRIILMCALLILPGLLAAGILVWLQPWALESKLVLLGGELFLCLVVAAALHDYIVRSLQTMANVVGALREEDYSVRARVPVPNDALGELSIEINALADLLAHNRTGAIEAAALVGRVVEEVEIPIFAFDPEQKLRLVNSAGEKLLQQSSAKLLGNQASDLGIETALSADNETLISLPFAGAARWFLRRSAFRQQGVPHTLVVLSDVSRALREEERRAWQRLIRVIGHELNNSLAPIKSIAGSLNTRLSDTPLDSEQRQDFERGLQIIGDRAASLNRFLQAYRQLVQIPPPILVQCSVSDLATRATALENRVRVVLIPGPNAILEADKGQLEQVLINLLRNAAEAVLESPLSQEPPNRSGTHGFNGSAPIVLTWKVVEKALVLTIEDSGAGLMNPSNAFVPFYTTKPEGSGIGLILSRQICEAHGGSLELSNRIGQRGCVATVTLPLSANRNGFPGKGELHREIRF